MWGESAGLQPLVLIPGSVALECKQVLRVAGKGWAESPLLRIYFAVSVLALRRTGVSEHTTRRPPGFELAGLWRDSEPGLKPEPVEPLCWDGIHQRLGARGKGEGGGGWGHLWRRVCTLMCRREIAECFPGARFC